jgi:hypothetical protein
MNTLGVQSVPLCAGPLVVTLQDGELRNLCVAGREVARRIYFAVRDERFDTPRPVFTRYDVRAEDNGFEVALAARCVSAAVDYAWTGRVTGGPGARLVVEVQGRARRAFASPRIGLNLLLGAELGGREFRSRMVSGSVRTRVFPREIAEERWGYGDWFTALDYDLGGLKVAACLEGGHAGIEDQRNFCDSSYKVYAYLPHAFPNLAHGDTARQVLTFTVSGKPRWRKPAAPPAPAVIRIGKAIPGSRMPRVTPSPSVGSPASGVRFSAIHKPDILRKAREVVWTFNPSSHLPDDGMFFENLPALPDQVAAVRRLARPGARIRIEPLTFDSRHPRPAPDPRNRTGFGAAWCAAAGFYLGLAAVDEVAFAVGPGPADAIQIWLAGLEGRRLLRTQVIQDYPPRLLAWAVEAEPGRKGLLCLVNLTDQPLAARLGQDRILDLPPYGVIRRSLG